jgi:hypothetical protein
MGKKGSRKNVELKGKWEREFDKKATRDAPFSVSADEKVDVSTTRLSSSFDTILPAASFSWDGSRIQKGSDGEGAR